MDLPKNRRTKKASSVIGEFWTTFQDPDQDPVGGAKVGVVDVNWSCILIKRVHINEASADWLCILMS